jgi:hypothetical protein
MLDFKATQNKRLKVADITGVLERRVITESLSKSLTRKHWTIIGSGPIGEKARDLLVKTEAGSESGFRINDRIVLAMGFFVDFYKRNGVFETSNIEERASRIIAGEFSSEEKRIIRQIADQFKGKPIMVRSSAHGDSRGTGTYESPILPDSNPTELENAIKKVLASQYSKKAVAWRNVTGFPEGMAVMFEPTVGRKMAYFDDLEDAFFAPDYSGFGYTSTANEGAYIRLVPGLPIGAVQSRSGFTITEDFGEEELSDLVHKSMMDAPWLDPSEILFKGYAVEVAIKRMNEQKIDSNPFITLKSFFEKMKRFQELCGGKAQYFEFAGVAEKRELIPTLLQTSDISLRTDFFEFPRNPERVVLKTNYVVGSNQLTPNGLITVGVPVDLDFLYKYNQTHKNYAVGYNSQLLNINLINDLSGGKPSKGERNINFSDISNASVIIEFPFGKYGLGAHGQNPIEHWKGQLDTANKVFLVGMLDFKTLKALSKERYQKGPSNTITICDVTLRVTASERQQKAIVELIE